MSSIEVVKGSPAKSESAVIASAISRIAQICGPDAATAVNKYLKINNEDQIVKTAHNAGSSDCWINAAEYQLLKSDKGKLAELFLKLAEEGHLTKEMFTQGDPNSDTSYGLGSRSGASLALDLALQKKYRATAGATDEIITQFESDLRGENVIAVFNGRGENGLNGSSSIKTILQSSNLASGMRFSVRWADQGGQHFYHMVSVQEIKDGRVYFYQPNPVKDIPGPNRQFHRPGLESMSISDFEKIIRVAYVPESVVAQRKNIKEVPDPAYAQAQRGELDTSEYIKVGVDTIIKPFINSDVLKKMSFGGVADEISDSIKKIASVGK
jgi:hypothetical protein